MMSSPTTQLAFLRGMGIYEPFQQLSSWGTTDPFRGDNHNILNNITSASSPAVPVESAAPENKAENGSHESTEPYKSDQEAGGRSADKTQRRLAQNREAARKSRLRKKAYVQQLESSRLKLAQLEQELVRARQQGVYINNNSLDFGSSRTLNSGIATFEMEYAHWVEEQHKQVSELRRAMQAHVGDVELRMLLENGLNHFNNLFLMKADAARADVFYLISGKWRTSVERFFLWIGGFRPSEILNVLLPQIEPLTDPQHSEICTLRQSCQQAEDALSQGVEKLQQTLSQSMAVDQSIAGSYRDQMAAAIERLEGLEGFANQADHLRSQTLHHMARILTTRQAARFMLLLGEYFERLRALSSLWSARPREPT
ncbi:Transcription factor TGA7 [Linum grandiflorum]